jgi:hypothetical protein
MRIFQLIAMALTALGRGLWNTAKGVGYWGEQFLRWPFSVLRGGGGQPAPEFTPTATAAELMDEYRERLEQAREVRTLDRDGINTVFTYVRAMPQARATIDLSALKPEVRDALLDLSDHDLALMRHGGLRAVRRFLDGDHAAKLDDVPPAGMTAHERMQWQIRAKLLKPSHSEPFALKS